MALLGDIVARNRIGNPQSNLIIVTLEEEETIRQGDVQIEVIPAYKFLLR